jgi:PEP-CTERM motif
MSKFGLALLSCCLSVPGFANNLGREFSFSNPLQNPVINETRSLGTDLDSNHGSQFIELDNHDIDGFPGKVSDNALQNANDNAAFKDNPHAFGGNDDDPGGTTVGTLANPEPGSFLLLGGGLAALLLRRRLAR